MKYYLLRVNRSNLFTKDDNMNNVIVTGATSFIGKHLIDALIEKGDRIAAVVRPHSKT